MIRRRVVVVVVVCCALVSQEALGFFSPSSSSVSRGVAPLQRSTTLRATADDESPSNGGDEKGPPPKNPLKRLWSGARRRIKGDSKGVDADDDGSNVASKEENVEFYAELEKRKKALKEKKPSERDEESEEDELVIPSRSRVVDRELKRKLSRNNIPREMNKELTEAFEPSTWQSPGDVITGVLRALKDDGVSKGDVRFGSVETFKKFASPASDWKNYDAIKLATFFTTSDYDILLHWDQVIFSPLRLSFDETKAFQTIKLKSTKTGQWTKVKWSLSLQEEETTDDVVKDIVEPTYDDAPNDIIKKKNKQQNNIGAKWLIDSVTIATR